MKRGLDIISGSCSGGEAAIEEKKPSIRWEGALPTLNGERFYPKIAKSASPHPGEGYNAVTITLDGSISSSLDWEEELAKAKECARLGYKILFSLDLGLFDRLAQPLSSKPQLMTLLTAVDHFIEEVWPRFLGETLGLALFIGKLDFTAALSRGDEEGENFKSWLGNSGGALEGRGPASLRDSEPFALYAANISFEALDLFAARAPEELAIFAIVDASAIKSPLLQARILFNERIEHFRLIAKNSLLPRDEISWGGDETPYGFFESGAPAPIEVERPATALLLPENSGYSEELFKGSEMALGLLLQKKIPFRVIPESLLTSEWEGLDRLVVAAQSLSPWGVRRLQGFIAAGGAIIAIDGAIEGIECRPFEQFIEQVIKSKEVCKNKSNDLFLHTS